MEGAALTSQLQTCNGPTPWDHLLSLVPAPDGRNGGGAKLRTFSFSLHHHSAYRLNSFSSDVRLMLTPANCYYSYVMRIDVHPHVRAFCVLYYTKKMDRNPYRTVRVWTYSVWVQEHIHWSKDATTSKVVSFAAFPDSRLVALRFTSSLRVSSSGT